MKIPIESFQKKTEYSINKYGALDVLLFPKKLWEFIQLNKNRTVGK